MDEIPNSIDKNQVLKHQITVIGLTCIFGWICVYLAMFTFKNYAAGLFIWLPITMGTISTLLYSFKNSADKKQIRNIGFTSLGIFSLGLLTFAWEGIICIVMAAPIGLFFNWIGQLIGYEIVKKRIKNQPAAMLLIVASVPAFMGIENTNKDLPTLRLITTSIDVKASPEIVWKNVVSFPQLEPPTEFIFKTGIAFPINAEIKGTGVGAIRSCNFSTGNFIEPITVWDEPNLLRFDVVEQPETMKELSFYDIHPKHLHGYFVSKHGEFKLIKLANGNTRIVGTTWYYNKIEPNFYWSIWSDYILHSIHERVLKHIKKQSELQLTAKSQS